MVDRFPKMISNRVSFGLDDIIWDGDTLDNVIYRLKSLMGDRGVIKFEVTTTWDDPTDFTAIFPDRLETDVEMNNRIKGEEMEELRIQKEIDRLNVEKAKLFGKAGRDMEYEEYLRLKKKFGLK